MKKKTEAKIARSERAVIARINRKLARDGEKLHKARRPVQIWTSPVDYYVIDDSNCITAEVHDLEDFARQCDALKKWETIEGWETVQG